VSVETLLKLSGKYVYCFIAELFRITAAKFYFVVFVSQCSRRGLAVAVACSAMACSGAWAGDSTACLSWPLATGIARRFRAS